MAWAEAALAADGPVGGLAAAAGPARGVRGTQVLLPV